MTVADRHLDAPARYMPCPGSTPVIKRMFQPQFVDVQSTKNLKYDNNNGFAVVSQTSTVATAKTLLDTLTKVKDILVTATGKTDEAVLGLVTDSRLLKHVQA